MHSDAPTPGAISGNSTTRSQDGQGQQRSSSPLRLTEHPAQRDNHQRPRVDPHDRHFPTNYNSDTTSDLCSTPRSPVPSTATALCVAALAQAPPLVQRHDGILDIATQSMGADSDCIKGPILSLDLLFITKLHPSTRAPAS